MANVKRSKVLIVDDNPDDVAGIVNGLRSHHVTAVVCEPSEVTIDDIASADLVLIDLDLEDWVGRGIADPIAHRPPDGIALATLLRRHLVGERDHSPTGFAILTAKVDSISRPFPPERRLHLLAGSNKMEWVFLKTEGELRLQIASLAHAIHSIPAAWRDGIQSVEEISGALQLDQRVLPIERFDEIIRSCHPPIHELTEWTHGLAFIRWLLQKVLVYPCFLWDTHRLAARLRLSVDELRPILNGDSKLRRQLSRLQYRGLLREFDGPRWWRDAVELFLWRITDGDSQDAEKICAALGQLVGAQLTGSDVDNPVICLDEDYKPRDRFYSLDEVVRVLPDDWPSYADYAYMDVQLVKSNERLCSLVVTEDRRKLPAITDG
jgi:hypothetical protein